MIVEWIGLAPKIIIFYLVLTALGLIQFNIIIAGAAVSLDILDYFSDLVK